ncbi:hypothetical protein T484DRAFT_3631376 [Baffinella frigidus]|nr:hypothetical protein T484DRAFT_3631376 [Cryptophyta sp. CCMP2293]
MFGFCDPQRCCEPTLTARGKHGGGDDGLCDPQKMCEVDRTSDPRRDVAARAATSRPPSALKHFMGLAEHGNARSMMMHLRQHPKLDINTCNVHGDTALHACARKNNVDVCDYLLHRHARICQNRLGYYPLDVAAQSSSFACLKVLKGTSPAPLHVTMPPSRSSHGAATVATANPHGAPHTPGHGAGNGHLRAPQHVGAHLHPSHLHSHSPSSHLHSHSPGISHSADMKRHTGAHRGEHEDHGEESFKVLRDAPCEADEVQLVPLAGIQGLHVPPSKAFALVAEGLGVTMVLDGKPVYAIFDYKSPGAAPFPPDTRMELSMQAGDRFRVYGIRKNGWCLVRPSNLEHSGRFDREGWVRAWFLSSLEGHDTGSPLVPLKQRWPRILKPGTRTPK